MSSSMSQLNASFFLHKNFIAKALQAIKDLPDKDYIWVERSFRTINNLPDILKAWGWQIIFSDDRDVSDIHFNGEKLGDEDDLFAAIAPFVREGSYIEMVGDEGYRWRWFFHNGKVFNQPAKFVYDEVK